MTYDTLDLEDALEAFAVSIWPTTESVDDTSEWSHAYDRLSGVELYLIHLRHLPLAASAGELKSLAGMRSNMLRGAGAKMPLPQGARHQHLRHVPRNV